MPKDKLNLDQLIHNLNQVGLNVIDFDNINLDYLGKKTERAAAGANEKSEIKKDKLQKYTYLEQMTKKPVN